MDSNVTTLVVAALGAGGIGAVLREVIAGVGKLTRGVSVKERDRKDDLAGERDRALFRERAAVQREDEANERLDAAERNRRRVEAAAAVMERIIILAGLAAQLPAPPVYEDTITPAHLREIQAMRGTP